MAGFRASYAVLGACLILGARQAVGQTVNLFGQNWTGDVSAHSRTDGRHFLECTEDVRGYIRPDRTPEQYHESSE